MKKNIFALTSLLIFMAGHAQAISLTDKSLNFIAPTLNCAGNCSAYDSSPAEGEIINDSNSHSFKGYTNGNWVSLSTAGAATPPTISIATSSSCGGNFTGCSLSSGVYSGTYTPPANVVYIKVTVVGGGGGGAAGGTSTGSGVNGYPTTFASYTAGQGTGATGSAADGGSGGSVTSGVVGLAVYGGNGGGSTPGSVTCYPMAGAGGSNPLGGAGGAGGSITAGSAAAANTGAGGGGGGGDAAASTFGGAGGGAGGYIQTVISGAALTAISSGTSIGVGTGGSGGTGTYNGGAGASGIIIVEEYYQ